MLIILWAVKVMSPHLRNVNLWFDMFHQVIHSYRKLGEHEKSVDLLALSQLPKCIHNKIERAKTMNHFFCTTTTQVLLRSFKTVFYSQFFLFSNIKINDKALVGNTKERLQ